MLHRNADGAPCALVTNIQKYTIHDGPGIRTEIFFKGCNMHCLWCSNPETLSARNELACYPDKCLTAEKCGWCLRACPHSGAPLRFDGDGRLASAPRGEECAACMRCAAVCPSRALKPWGELKTLEALLREIEEDRSFYERSGGGVTLNGGEVLLQWEFARSLLAACRARGIGSCVESALNVATEHMEAVLPFTDLLITDVKHMDSARHKAITGSGNEQILRNIARAAQSGTPMVVRTPVVPGYNADEENLRRTGRFLRETVGDRLLQYQLLPYRKMGTEKYASIGRPYPLENYQPPERGDWERSLRALAQMLREDFGLPAVAGSGHRLQNGEREDL